MQNCQTKHGKPNQMQTVQSHQLKHCIQSKLSYKAIGSNQVQCRMYAMQKVQQANAEGKPIDKQKACHSRNHFSEATFQNIIKKSKNTCFMEREREKDITFGESWQFG